MTNIKQEILNTIDIIVNQKINSLKFDKTVRGTVKKVLNDDYYKINISGAEYTLKYTKEKLKIYSSVYVLIPNNDYKNMFVLCGVEK